MFQNIHRQLNILSQKYLSILFVLGCSNSARVQGPCFYYVRFHGFPEMTVKGAILSDVTQRNLGQLLSRLFGSHIPEDNTLYCL
jgi:hypothetical protein